MNISKPTFFHTPKSVPIYNDIRITGPVLLLLISSAVFLLYLPTLDFPFQFDDKPNIVQNTNIRMQQLDWNSLKQIAYSVSGRNRPFSMFSFSLNYYFGRYNPFGYRLVNVIIHILNGILLFYLLKYTIELRLADFHPLGKPSNNPGVWTGKTSSPSFLIPLATISIWLFHPLATNSVTYIVQRMNSMAALSFLCSLVCYIKARNPAHGSAAQLSKRSGSNTKIQDGVASKLWYGASLVSGFAAITSKEIAITLPLMIFFYEWFFFQDLDSQWFQKKIFAGLTIFSLITIIFILCFGFGRLVGYFDLYDQLDFTLSQRLMTEFRVVLYYVSLVLFPAPSRLNIDHDIILSQSLFNPLSTTAALIIIVGLLFLAIRLAKRNRILSYCIFWYFCNLAVESTVIPLDLIFEHRVYLSSMLLIFIFALFLFRCFRSVAWRLVVFSTCILILGIWTHERNQVWKDAISLWSDSAAKSPNKSRPHVNLGEAYAAAGNFQAAIHQYQKALAINPYSDYTHYNIGAAYYAQYDIKQAIEHFRMALKANPDLAEAHNNLGVALIDQKKVEEGIHHYKEALRLKPNHPEAPDNLRKAQTGLDQINARILSLEKQITKEPENEEILYRLGYLYYRKGHFQTAETFYRKALSFQDGSVKILNALAMLYAETEREPEAIALLEQIAALEPGNPSVSYNLACLYARANKSEPSIRWLRKAIEHGYNNWELIQKDRDLNRIRNTAAYRGLFETEKAEDQ
ncbi:MAG: tetratricopeptide repeat protein [Thermodesulfobacteriota bacterium]